MDRSSKRKRSDDDPENRLFKKFEVLESRLRDLCGRSVTSNGEGRGVNNIEHLNASLSDIVSFMDGHVNDEELDYEEERFSDEDDNNYNEDERNFEQSVIEELPPENPPIEEIYLSDDEPSPQEDFTEVADRTRQNPDIVLVSEESPKLDEVSLNAQNNGLSLHPDIRETWACWTRSGIPLQDKQELMRKYAPPKFLKTPEINQEILVTLHKRPIEKDEYIRSSQEMLSSALTALGSTMSSLLSENEKSDRLKALNTLNDTAKLLTELFYFDTEKRRSNIISWKPKPVQNLLVETKPDEFLFGKNLDAKISEAQRAGRMGRLKPYVFRRTNNRPYKFFPSPYHWHGREDEGGEQNFVLNPMKQEANESKVFCKKEKEEGFSMIKIE